MNEFFINHWEALSSLLLSVVAITIAIISARITYKQSNAQIKASSKDAKDQILSIKVMTKEAYKSTKEYLYTMKSLTSVLIENYIINIESDIMKYSKEKALLEEEHKIANFDSLTNEIRVYKCEMANTGYPDTSKEESFAIWFHRQMENKHYPEITKEEFYEYYEKWLSRESKYYERQLSIEESFYERQSSILDKHIRNLIAIKQEMDQVLMDVKRMSEPNIILPEDPFPLEY